MPSRVVWGHVRAALCPLPLLLAAPALAGQQASLTTAFTIDGPPAPVPPAVVSRDERGGVTVRAVRVPEAIVLDGRLDDRLYRETDAIGDFVQMEPRAGQPATEKTEVWIGYDDRALYVGARLWESDPSRRVTSDMRRDANNLGASCSSSTATAARRSAGGFRTSRTAASWSR
ncbi:MAG: hypothetical protein HY657_09185 [Acidobacteria bacterium]|nr:hypothetical protein [Acidobacteriota bacterium]